MRSAISILLVLMLVMLSGCRTMQQVEHGNWASLEGKVAAGDTVEVITNDGQVHRFVVTEVSPDALSGADTRIAREDITRLQVSAVHKGRTFGAAFGGAGAVLLILIAAATASLLGG